MKVADRESGRMVGTIGAAELLAGRRRAVRRESERRIAFQFSAENGRDDKKESGLVSS